MSKFKEITEKSAKILIPVEEKISKKLPVFYNPVMKFNRDISVLVLNNVDKKDMQMALPLSGTGIRGIRLLQELKKNKIKNITFNDYSEFACKQIKKNLELNNLKLKKENVEITNKDANLFLLESTGFDYIDLDPFGTPNPFLDASAKRISRNGILAVTATDTSALCGTYERACKRKYWAAPIKDEHMHETGLRILIRKIQLVGAQYDKALIPIFSYSKDHYMKVFLRCDKGKTKVDDILKQHGIFRNGAGPLWTGRLWDEKLVKKIVKENKSKFLETILEESKLNVVGFHDIHSLVKKYKLKNVPKNEKIIEQLKKQKIQFSRTHFLDTALKADCTEEEFVEILKNIKQ